MFTASLKYGDTQIELIKLDITNFKCSTDKNFHRFAQKFMARKIILMETLVDKCLSFKIIKGKVIPLQAQCGPEGG